MKLESDCFRIRWFGHKPLRERQAQPAPLDSRCLNNEFRSSHRANRTRVLKKPSSKLGKLREMSACFA